MPKKQWTDEERKAFGEKMKASKASKAAKLAQAKQEPKQVHVEDAPAEAGVELGINQLTNMVLELQKQLQESQKVNEAFRQGAATNAPSGNVIQKSSKVNTLFSEDLSIYETTEKIKEKLFAEPRLKRIAFDSNYEVDLKVKFTREYDKKDGTIERQPQFNVELIGIMSDDQGNPTPKRYIARKLIFFEDPITALEVARNNSVSPDDFGGEQEFLNAMRYLRLRDWVFEFFWPPKPDADRTDFKDEVIGGQVVRTFQKSSEDPVGIPFDKLNTKLRA